LLEGWSQQALAERAGIDRRTLGALEAGSSSPQLRTAEALAEALALEVAALFPGEVPNGHSGAPQVARVGIRTLRAIRAALPPDSGEILADVDHLIEVAEQAGRPL
jgi:transcriptional regulator with XRE-family HTH domain